jgi:hypothetical protein
LLTVYLRGLMKKLLFPIIALCFSVSFAQFEDDEFEEDELEKNELEENEWANFDYQHAGLTQTEFQKVKESGMSKEKLMYLLEIGVRPADYLKEPWKNLGVSEKEWLQERAGGMDDSDIDRTYKNRSGDQWLAHLSLLVPSLYQWYAGEIAKAITIDALEAAAVGLTVYLALNNEGDENLWVWGTGAIAFVHIGSWLDAVISTLWDSNPDARNFSFGIMPTGKNSFTAAAILRF